MLGLYSLGFVLVSIIKVLASQESMQKKGLKIALLAPVICYVAMTMKIVTPLTKFVMANLQSMIGG